MPEATVSFIPARREHVPAIVAMLADDELGSGREDTSAAGLAAYEKAFDAIERHSSSTLYVAVQDGEVVGTFQLTFIPGMSQRGMFRADVEAVRIASQVRGQGLGEQMMAFARRKAEEGGAGLLQLASNKVRTKAHRFYERLGFSKSHDGFKLKL